ncbi:hypothetical protein GDO86_018721 [Hymenochirus boettgeri]|uniref:Uncharacterized protein n=1 Tax=Hymenochirus boettgeri TaxID=247094 RepID=A0A8T2IMS3_9PIPI|nr:hypothetical protein GDO86_018721 [Hymenochirus boettgeri]
MDIILSTEMCNGPKLNGLTSTCDKKWCNPTESSQARTYCYRIFTRPELCPRSPGFPNDASGSTKLRHFQSPSTDHLAMSDRYAAAFLPQPNTGK